MLFVQFMIMKLQTNQSLRQCEYGHSIMFTSLLTEYLPETWERIGQYYEM